eukprot:444064-Pyramimonas_sp.AAC.1
MTIYPISAVEAHLQHHGHGLGGVKEGLLVLLRGNQSQGSQRVHTHVGINHRGASGYIPTWGPITGEPAGIYPRGTNHSGTSGYIPTRGPITGEPADIYLQVAVVRHREALADGQEGDERAVHASRLATHQLHGVGVLLLRHDGRPRAHLPPPGQGSGQRPGQG